MHRQLAARRYCARAIFDNVSPSCTIILVSKAKPERSSGSTSCVPAATRLGSLKPGFAANSSCQRAPRPKCSSAKLHNESPGFTITVCARTTGATTEGATGTGAISDAVGGVKVLRKRLKRGAAGTVFGADGLIIGTEGAATTGCGAGGFGTGAISEMTGAVKVGRSMLNRGAAGAAPGFNG